VVETDDVIPAEAVEVAAVGDVNLSERIGRLIAANGADYPWRAVAAHLSGADLAVANLECAASTLGRPAARTYVFRADPAALPAMATAGVDAASVANNHTFDYGPEAFLDTIANLRKAGLEAVGGGADRAGAYAPVVFERKGRRVSVLAASRVVPPGWAAGEGSPGMATAYDTPRLMGAVRAARSGADAVVVMVHWGTEGNGTPGPAEVRLAHQLVDAGATAVLGSHPHVLQPVVRYRDAVIAYSLGNFVFSSPAGAEAARRSHILRVGILPSGGVAVARVPVRIAAGQPRPL
jgi:poly-gamma-glutamate synthesis protein (capsule biosynthesis protein)